MPPPSGSGRTHCAGTMPCSPPTAATNSTPSWSCDSPAVTDITRDEVQAFHDTLDDANAPAYRELSGDRARAEAYQLAVRRLRRAWAACETAGKAAGTGYLDEPTRRIWGQRSSCTGMPRPALSPPNRPPTTAGCVTSSRR